MDRHTTSAPDPHFAVVTPSFARDFETCRELNESVLTFAPPEAKHYIVVDRCDLRLFRPLAGGRTIVTTVEDVIPAGYHKLRGSKKWWFSTAAMVPAKGWLIQQFVKLCAPHIVDEPLIVNVDSDVRFVRKFDAARFVRNRRTRLYRRPGGITGGMQHVKWHHNACRLLGVAPDALPMNDYVGNLISWDGRVAVRALEHVERTTHKPWHVAFAHARAVSEYLTYGLYVDKVVGAEAAGVWLDPNSMCHTYWGPGPLARADVEAFTRSLRDEDVAFSIAGYTGTPPEVTRVATRLALSIAAG